MKKGPFLDKASAIIAAKSPGLSEYKGKKSVVPPSMRRFWHPVKLHCVF